MKFYSYVKPLLLAFLACIVMEVRADDVDANTAQQIATQFLNQRVSSGKLNAPAIRNLRLVKTRASKVKSSAADYYIFSGSAAYVVVAGEDKVPAVLAYGDGGELDVDNLPPAMTMMLNHYAEQVEALQSGKGIVSQGAVPLSAVAVAPLLTALWDQTAPYYNHTPTQSGRHCYTGCPATSLSMVFYKWKYPATYPAVAAITGSYGSASAPALEARAADWDNMIDDYSHGYTSAQAEAVSWLMRYVGQAEHMDYSINGSGAMGEDIVDACKKFGYSNAELLTYTELVYSNRRYGESSPHYTNDQWNAFLMNELQNGRPMVYCAYDLSGSSPSGHAFNVDGCDLNGKYHVNWGWSGVGNGYFTLHNFVASTSATGQGGSSYYFNKGEQVVRYIYPANVNTPSITATPTSLSMSATVGEAVSKSFTVKGTNLSGDVSVKLNDANGVYSVSTTSIPASSAKNGVTVTVTYAPKAAGTQNASITLSSSGASTVTVTLSGTANKPALEVYTPVLANASNVGTTSFTASWTDQTPSQNVKSYTLYVKNASSGGGQSGTNLLGSIDGSKYPGSFVSLTLTSPWAGKNVRGGNNSVYFTTSKKSNKNGYITFTVPSGYSNAPFTVKITTATTSYGAGNLTVKSAKTSAVGHSFVKGETYSWVVAASAGESITISSTASSYSPYMTKIEVYAGNATLNYGASESGNANERTITGITNKTYTVENLNEGDTYTYKVKAIYTDNSESAWSNEKSVTLEEEGGGDTPAIVKVNPVMQATDVSAITATSFKAKWTHNVDAANVKGYTLYVTKTASAPQEDEPILLGTLDGSKYTGSYVSISLSSPWAGKNVKGGNGAVYFTTSTNSKKSGYITYTVPLGYSNETFTVQITTARSNGAGNLSVKSARTSSVSHNYSNGETYTWTVKASSGEKITINSTASSKSPDMAMIKVYAGDISANLTATETGDANQRVISGIAAGVTEYVVKNLEAGATYSYYLMVEYVDGDKVKSNTEEVVLGTNFNFGEASGIEVAIAEDKVVEKTYYNLNGQKSLTPWKGINVVVVRFNDGSVKKMKIKN